MTTRVINIKTLEPYDVYIGTRVHFTKYENSKWRNIFKIEKVNGKEVPGSREKVISQYREYILNQPDLLKLIPIELKDKTLGCWCKPEACHGDVLAKLADKK